MVSISVRRVERNVSVNVKGEGGTGNRFENLRDLYGHEMGYLPLSEDGMDSHDTGVEERPLLMWRQGIEFWFN